MNIRTARAIVTDALAEKASPAMQRYQKAKREREARMAKKKRAKLKKMGIDPSTEMLFGRPV